MTLYQQHTEIQKQIEEARQKVDALDKKRLTIEASPQYKDERIKDLEKEIASLKKELAYFKQAAERKHIFDYSNQKCTGDFGCSCRSCNDL